MIVFSILLIIYLLAGVLTLRYNRLLGMWLAMLADRRHGFHPALVLTILVLAVVLWPLTWMMR